MAGETKTETEGAIHILQCAKLKGSLAKPQKDALHLFKDAVAQAFGECERKGVPARIILAFMLLRAASVTTDELAREMSGAAARPLGPSISGGVCDKAPIKKLPPPHLAALHAFQNAVGNAFGACEKVVEPKVILAVFSEHAAELNLPLAIQGP